MGVAVGGERKEFVGGGDAVLDDVASHASARFLGEKADDFKRAVFLVFEDGGDDDFVECTLVDGFEVFLRGEVDEQVSRLLV